MRWYVFLLAALAALACGCGRDEGPSAPPAAARERARRPDLPPTARPEMLAELREAHAAPRHPSDGGGRAWLELPEDGDGSVRVGRSGTWTIVYEAGPEGVSVGGTVRLLVPPYWDWSPAQGEAPDAPGYTTVESLADGVELATLSGNWFLARIKSRALREGERLRFVYGAGSSRAVADRYAERGSRFWIAVDGDGDGYHAVLADSPSVTVRPGVPGQLRLRLPGTARPGEHASLHVALLDRLGNGGCAFEGRVTLVASPEDWEVPSEVVFTAEDRGVKVVEIGVGEAGVHRLYGSTDDARSGLEALSNPMLVSADAPRILWGDLHGHSNFSDGTGTPEDYFRYARDVAGLDVVALTDHDHWGVLFLDEHPDMWDEIQDATRRFHDPGHFVTVLGFEWTNWLHGHRHVLYFGDEGPILSSIDERYETPTQLWDGLRAQHLDALTFAHHSAGGPIATNWDFAPDPEFEPVTEVASVHGSSEAPDAPIGIYRPVPGNYVRDALARGYRLGFIGSGDSHDGHPGLAHLASPSGGLAAILSEDLTREGVREAMHARRVYATNGPRIVLQCALDDARMGSIVPAGPEGEAATLFFRAIACGPIDSVDVVRSGEVVLRVDAEEHFEIARAIELEPLRSGEYVYVRVVQTDRGAAWSSPIYVE